MTPGAMLLSAAIAELCALPCAGRSPRAWLACTLVGCAGAFTAAVTVLASGAAWEWRAGLGPGAAPVHLLLDGLSAFFLLLLSTVSAAGAVYSREYWSDARHPASACAGRRWWNALVLAMGAVLVAADGLHFLLAWEAFAVCAYLLITLDARERAVRAAGWLYLAASHTGTLTLFAFFASLAARTGSWELGPLRERPELAQLFWLALFGFGIKAGLFPLHVWLPSAHASAPSHVSAMLSGVAIKLGIYGIVRFSGWLPPPAGAGWVLAGLGLASAVLGVAFALGQHDLKRLLAYHSVENIGIILIGVGLALIATAHGDADWGRLALAGGLLHVWNHGLFKALLFLGAGSVLHATGTREMSRLGGLWRAMPWTTGLFALGAVAIAGLPPLNGFVSEWLVYQGLFDAAGAHGEPALAAMPAIVLLAITGALALACFVKVCGVVFLGAARSEQDAHECGASMRCGMLLLAAGCVAIGLAPALFWPALCAAVGAWRGTWAGAAPASLVTLGWAHAALALLALLASAGLFAARRGARRAPTWDCGYAAPSARMQYTAGSFASILTEWFAWILRPRRHAEPPLGVLPTHARVESHTPETVLELVVEPAAALVMFLSRTARRLQHGRVQSYLLYLILGLAALAVLSLV